MNNNNEIDQWNKKNTGVKSKGLKPTTGLNQNSTTPAYNSIVSASNNEEVNITLTQADPKTINIPITRVAREHTQLTIEIISSSISSMEQETDFNTGEHTNINTIDIHRDIFSAKDDRTNN